MKLKNISLKDKRIFDKYLNLSEHELSAYAFANIYAWKNLFDIRWAIIEYSLCVFVRDKIGSFLYLPPLSQRKRPGAIKKIFEILDRFNANSEISRIENAQDSDLDYYRSLGYLCGQRSPEYLCAMDDLIQLKGNAFKSKRSCFNYFLRNYVSEYRPYTSADKIGCLRLHELWSKERAASRNDQLYRMMLGDSYQALKTSLSNYNHLKLIARVVTISGELKAFTLGYRLSPGVFCILFEIADLSIRGLAQFIFRQFSLEAQACVYINIMDDSGLENLRRVKLSYRPQKLIHPYTVKREEF